jgi:hypothetical protein
VKALLFFGFALLAASGQAAPREWLDGTVLEDCRHCKSDAFTDERKAIANQAGFPHDPASGMGYVVTIDHDGPFVWGRAALVGTGNLIRTDAHVLFTDTGELKAPRGRVYFEPMQHRGARNWIEIDTSSVQRGGPLSPLEVDFKHDWAIARLQEDAIEKFDGERVFAFLWDIRVTHDDILTEGYRRASTLVLSHDRAFAIHDSCASVIDDHPSRYAFGVAEVFFLRCPAEHLQVGSSGSGLAVLSADGVWSLAGQIIAGGTSERVRQAPDENAAPSGPSSQQLFLGNVPLLEQTLAIAYLQELIRRGLDPRER